MHKYIYAAMLLSGGMLAMGQAYADEEETGDAGDDSVYYEAFCMNDNLTLPGTSDPDARDFLKAFADKWKSPGIKDYLSRKLPPVSSGNIEYPPESDEDADDEDASSEYFTARVYRSPKTGLSFALHIASQEDLMGTSSFCFYRFSPENREFIPLKDFFDKRYDGFNSVNYGYLIEEDGSIFQDTYFMYDESEVPLYTIEQKYEWDGSDFTPKTGSLITGKKLVAPGSPDGKWDRLSLTDIDGDKIPEIWLARSDNGNTEVFAGNTGIVRLSSLDKAPKVFRVSPRGLVSSDDVGLNTSYTELKDSQPANQLRVSCKEAEGGAKSCVYRMNGRNIAEAEAQDFISQFADAREIKPEFISITDIRSDEDVE